MTRGLRRGLLSATPSAPAQGPVVTLHVVSSLDGFIARHDNTVEWLNSPTDAYERGVSEATDRRS